MPTELLSPVALPREAELIAKPDMQARGAVLFLCRGQEEIDWQDNISQCLRNHSVLRLRRPGTVYLSPSPK